MELLIPGLILVALMVWASTKIKRISASAFEPEQIEMPLYLIQKPGGFLHVLNDDSGLDFSAYSKELESLGKRDYRVGMIEVEILDGKTLDERISEIEKLMAEMTVSPYLDGGERSAIVQGRRHENDVDYFETRKIVARGSRLIELRIAILADHAKDFGSKTDKILGGFLVKM